MISISGDYYVGLCALLSDDSVRCWGREQYGHLGAGNGVVDIASPSASPVNLGTNVKVASVHAFRSYACAILDDRSLKCWGANGSNQLGYGDTRNRGLSASDMGDNLPAVEFGDGERVLMIAAGKGNSRYTCAILEGGTVKCWGKNDYGMTGMEYQNVEGKHTYTGKPKDQVAMNFGGGKAKSIDCGSYHCCVVLESEVQASNMWCWGYGYWGQLGTESQNSPKHVPVPSKLTNVKSVYCFYYDTTCATLDNGDTKCFGFYDTYPGSASPKLLGIGLSDAVGRVVLGDQAGEMATLQRIDFGTGRKAVSMDCNFYHCCAALDDGTVRCWGKAEDTRVKYMLGYEDSVDLSQPRADAVSSGGTALKLDVAGCE
jgi:alpha-tubulin suppressor-like RCC1 family protein